MRNCWVPILVMLAAGAEPVVSVSPLLVGHRGLPLDAPENTLAAFAACVELRLGFELDIRRTRDGHLVCLHDDTLGRTTDGKGKVADLTLAELKKLDAGAWYAPAFRGQRVPTLEEVFVLLSARTAGPRLVALDLKIGDETVAADVVRLAVKHGVLDQLVCIGRAIDDAAVRRKLRTADAGVHAAVLVKSADDLQAACADTSADWVYVRFVPTNEQSARIHAAGKKIFLSGPKVIGQEPETWRAARAAGVDALLTDYPIDCRRVWRAPRAPAK